MVLVDVNTSNNLILMLFDVDAVFLLTHLIQNLKGLANRRKITGNLSSFPSP